MHLNDTPEYHRQPDASGRMSRCVPGCAVCEKVRNFGRREVWVEVFNLAEKFGEVEGASTDFPSFVEVLRGLALKAGGTES